MDHRQHQQSGQPWSSRKRKKNKKGGNRGAGGGGGGGGGEPFRPRPGQSAPALEPETDEFGRVRRPRSPSSSSPPPSLPPVREREYPSSLAGPSSHRGDNLPQNRWAARAGSARDGPSNDLPGPMTPSHSRSAYPPPSGGFSPTPSGPRNDPSPPSQGRWRQDRDWKQNGNNNRDHRGRGAYDDGLAPREDYYGGPAGSYRDQGRRGGPNNRDRFRDEDYPTRPTRRFDDRGQDRDFAEPRRGAYNDDRRRHTPPRSASGKSQAGDATWSRRPARTGTSRSPSPGWRGNNAPSGDAQRSRHESRPARSQARQEASRAAATRDRFGDGLPYDDDGDGDDGSSRRPNTTDRPPPTANQAPPRDARDPRQRSHSLESNSEASTSGRSLARRISSVAGPNQGELAFRDEPPARNPPQPYEAPLQSQPKRERSRNRERHKDRRARKREASWNAQGPVLDQTHGRPRPPPDANADLAVLSYGSLSPDDSRTNNSPAKSTTETAGGDPSRRASDPRSSTAATEELDHLSIAERRVALPYTEPSAPSASPLRHVAAVSGGSSYEQGQDQRIQPARSRGGTTFGPSRASASGSRSADHKGRKRSRREDSCSDEDGSDASPSSSSTPIREDFSAGEPITLSDGSPTISQTRGLPSEGINAAVHSNETATLHDTLGPRPPNHLSANQDSHPAFPMGMARPPVPVKNAQHLAVISVTSSPEDVEMAISPASSDSPRPAAHKPQPVVEAVVGTTAVNKTTQASELEPIPGFGAVPATAPSVTNSTAGSLLTAGLAQPPSQPASQTDSRQQLEVHPSALGIPTVTTTLATSDVSEGHPSPKPGQSVASDAEEDELSAAEGEAGTPPRALPTEVYSRIAQVGEGTYGQVFKAKSAQTGVFVALKKIRMEAEKDGFPVTAMREIKLLQMLRHKNIVRLHEMMTVRGSVYMVFEYMEHDLNGVLNHPAVQFTPAHLKSLASQLLQGLGYLHRKCVLHRDLKGSNILLSNTGLLKLADFGLARLYAKQRPALGVDDLPSRTVTRGEAAGNTRPEHNYTNRVVTLWYRPPELLLGATHYGAEVDTWGAGCIFLELFTRRPVFQGMDEIHQLTVVAEVLGPPEEQLWEGVQALPWWELVWGVAASAGAGAGGSQKNGQAALTGGSADAAQGSGTHAGADATEGTEAGKPLSAVWSARFRSKFSHLLSPAALDVAQGLLSLDPRKRLSADEALALPYFTEEKPRAQRPEKVLTSLKGEWHELESRRARQKATGPNVNTSAGAGAGSARGVNSSGSARDRERQGERR